MIKKWTSCSSASVAIIAATLGVGCGVDAMSIDDTTAASSDELIIQEKPTPGPLEPIEPPDLKDGVVLRGGGAAERDQFRPAIASDGRDFFAVWSDRRHGLAEVYGARISRDGTLLDEHGILIAQAPAESYDVHAKWRYRCPSVAFDGENYLVVWSDARTTRPSVYARRIVAKTGLPLDPGAIPITPGEEAVEPAVAFNGSRFLITYSVYTESDWDGRTWHHLKLYGTLFPPDARPRGAFPLTDTPQDYAWEYQARIASNGSEFAVAYINEIFGSPRVFVVPVGRDGAVPVGTPFGYPMSPWGTKPSIAFDGKNYLVVFDYGDIFGRQLNRDAVPFGFFVPISHGPGSNASVAFNGEDYVVAWDREEYSGRAGISNIFGSRVSREGVVSPLAVDDYFGLSENLQEHPAIAATREGELVVWQELALGDWDIRGTPVSTTGVAARLDGLLYSK